MRKVFHTFLTITIILSALLVPVAQAQTEEESVVRAVLFYSPTCGHCHYVINEVLIPMVETHGDRLQILAINVTEQSGQYLYQAAIDRFQIPEERLGVPMLLVGQVILVGSGEIPDQFPGIVEEGLAGEGIDWPDIPELSQALAQQPSEAEPTGVTATVESAGTPGAPPTDSVATSEPVVAGVEPTEAPAATEPVLPESVVAPDTDSALVLSPGGQEVPLAAAEEPPSDPAGFALASIILTGMVAALIYALRRLLSSRAHLRKSDELPGDNWLFPLLVVAGLGVAAYLAYVEITHVEAVCGPVGECNIVQASSYARILGVPVAVLGLVGYAAIGLLWVAQKRQAGKTGRLPALGLLGLTLIATLFSIYLTLLELFAIRAVCAWCLTSAVITTVLMLMVVVPLTAGSSSPQSEPPPSPEGVY